MSNDICPTIMIIYKKKSKINLQSQEKKQMSNDICPTLMIIYKAKSKIDLQSQEKKQMSNEICHPPRHPSLETQDINLWVMNSNE